MTVSHHPTLSIILYERDRVGTCENDNLATDNVIILIYITVKFVRTYFNSETHNYSVSVLLQKKIQKRECGSYVHFIFEMLVGLRKETRVIKVSGS